MDRLLHAKLFEPDAFSEDEDCQFRNKFAEAVYLHPVTLELVFNSAYPESIGGFTWGSLVLPPHVTSVRMFSRDSGSTDIRGGGCGNLHLPVEDFQVKFSDLSGIKLKHIVEGIYRLKGSKYDWEYELLAGLLLVIEGDYATIEVYWIT